MFSERQGAQQFQSLPAVPNKHQAHTRNKQATHTSHLTIRYSFPHMYTPIRTAKANTTRYIIWLLRPCRMALFTRFRPRDRAAFALSNVSSRPSAAALDSLFSSPMACDSCACAQLQCHTLSNTRSKRAATAHVGTPLFQAFTAHFADMHPVCTTRPSREVADSGNVLDSGTATTTQASRAAPNLFQLADL